MNFHCRIHNSNSKAIFFFIIGIKNDEKQFRLMLNKVISLFLHFY